MDRWIDTCRKYIKEIRAKLELQEWRIAATREKLAKQEAERDRLLRSMAPFVRDEAKCIARGDDNE